MGSPSEFSIGVVFGIRPLAVVGSCWEEYGSEAKWLRFRIFSMEAGK